MTPPKPPTEEQIRLVAWADVVERDGPLTSLYYRLYPQIIEARDAIDWEKKQIEEQRRNGDAAQERLKPEDDLAQHQGDETVGVFAEAGGRGIDARSG